ncbi:MAG: NADH:ubiquinone reductase (Na(+)-transporting) subunit B [Betaproteobacteria bacterium]|nr:NADH:ubiquinone reductase (Na(+)-transporting) subunit B [Betaproteobacteria bacterium]MCC7215347.1 NADH:ubiquinone reductase (Na(+)-transporting) subunit B [Burkholderiales bacterium]
MRAFRAMLDRVGHHFEKGGRYERLYPLWEAADTFFYTPASVTRTGAHVRDALDLKRMMMTVVIATLPCVLMAMYNTGLQANLALDPAKAAGLAGWRHELLRMLGVGYSPASIVACTVHGALYFLPLYVVTMVVGLSWEVLFAIVRRVEVNEGFFVTGILFPLILPPETPLWQAALGISFGVVLAKEVYGGTGMNFVNPALAARAFVFFAYPAEMSGDRVWTALDPALAVDGFSGATALAQLRQATGPLSDLDLSWWTAFVGLEPGSMGETSALACLIGAVVLLVTGIGSWRTMAAVTLGTIAMATTFNLIGSATNPYFGVPFWWHMVLGGWAFGMVFMATDPVTSPFTDRGKWIYGIMIGALVVLIRTVNPAYPEAMMLVILFMNVMAPLIDYPLVRANVRRRASRG